MLLGYLALVARTVCLGLERPFVKALGERRDSVAATTLFFGLGLLFILPLWLYEWLRQGAAYFAHWPLWLGAALVTGVLYAVAFHTYVWGLSVGEVSYLTPLYATAFLWLYTLDVVTGNAPLGWRPLTGIVCVWAGIVLLNLTTAISFHNWLRAIDPRTLMREPGAIGMLIYAFGLATGRLVDKSVAGIAPPLLYAFVNNAPCVLAGIAILLWRKQGGLPLALLRERPAVAWIGAAAGMGAYIALLFALRTFPPSTVEPVTQLSVFIAVALGGFWFKEPVRARLLPSLLVVAGAVLLLWK